MATAARSTPPVRSDRTRATVLLAEDDGALRAPVAGALRRRGYDVVEARDGHQLLRHLEDRLGASDERARLDLVVTDVRAPGLTGLEVLAGLRAFSRSLPVVVVTALGDGALHAQARKCGVSAALCRPFALDALARVVDLCLARALIGAPVERT